jgi:hypothetical protein
MAIQFITFVLTFLAANVEHKIQACDVIGDVTVSKYLRADLNKLQHTVK